MGNFGKGDPNKPEFSQDGGDVNPYIPKFISNAPWYLEKEGEKEDYLKHQRSEKSTIETDWYDRSKKGKAATKYRKGACTNCGAMTHKAVDCMERPRKIGAKYSGKDIAADEVIQDITTTWDSKRDRWNGFEASDYKNIVKKFEEKEKERRENGEEEEEGDKVDGVDDEKVKSLRERGDKASYLEDLTEDSAMFNPKSRTLRQDGTLNDRGQFERPLNDKALEYDKFRQMAEGISETGAGSIHMEASPTEGILKLKKLQEEQEKEKNKLKRSLLEKYGGEEHMISRPKEVQEAPVQAKIVNTEQSSTSSTTSTKSKYPEDIYPGNHTSVWGSYWKDGKWGFACCHSLIKQSYCLRDKGLEINDKKEGNQSASKRTIDEVS